VRRRALETGVRVCTLVCVAAPLLSSPASAQRIVEVTAEGECPTESDLRAAVEARFGPVASDGEGWRISTGPDPSGTGTRFALRAPDGSTALERRVATPDCGALASAFAIIADAYFVDLGVREPPPEPALVRPPERLPERPPRPPRPPIRPPPARPASVSLAILGGGDIGFEPVLPTAFATVRGGFRPRDFPLEFWLGLAGSAPTTQVYVGETDTQHIERWALALRLDATLRVLRSPVILDVSAGAALARSEVTALDLPSPNSVTRYHGGVALGVAGGLPLGEALSLRAEVAATIWPPGDTYTIDPGGVAVAESPLLSLTAGAGVQWETNR
jgi:hypothetical protein